MGAHLKYRIGNRSLRVISVYTKIPKSTLQSWSYVEDKNDWRYILFNYFQNIPMRELEEIKNYKPKYVYGF